TVHGWDPRPAARITGGDLRGTTRPRPRGTQVKEARSMGDRQDPRAEPFQLRELCTRLGVSYRDARYVCEKGWLPAGVAPQPGRGNHRQLTPAQAVWLGIVLRLKACGLTTRAAARVAARAERVRGMTRNLGWDWPFAPFDGALETDRRWYLEVGDVRLVRFVT